jgi:tetratricopeptide (TPR) repeat protein
MDATTRLLEHATSLLAHGEYEAAFDALEEAARSRDAPRRARALLELASLNALYGERGASALESCLDEAARVYPPVARTPRFEALRATLGAWRAPEPDLAEIRRIVEAEGAAGDAVAAFHLLDALEASGALDAAGRLLSRIASDQLPRHLVWRYHSIAGRIHLALGRSAEAVGDHARAVELAPPAERNEEILHWCEALIEAGRAAESVALLSELSGAAGSASAPDRAWANQLLGQAEQALGNPGRAAEAYAEALVFEREDADGPSVTSLLGLGQSLADSGQPLRAAEVLQEAMERVGEEDLGYVAHELGLAWLDAGEPVRALELLLIAGQDRSYHYRGEALADAGDAAYRAGDAAAAERHARDALAGGTEAAAAAALVLGHLAYDRFAYAEAYAWYARAAEASEPGSSRWVWAHKLQADCLVQDGWRDPARILAHAQAVLPHVNPADEWRLTLEQYAAGASARLGERRTLN